MMELQINNCPIDVEFQGESTVVDIVNSVTGWARERDLVFMEAYINNTCYPVDSIPEMPLGDVNILNFIVQSRADICISSINEIIIYCNKALSFIRKSVSGNNTDLTAAESLQGGIDWLIEITNKLLKMLSLDEEAVKYRDKNLRYYIESLKSFKEKIKNSGNTGGFSGVLKSGEDIFTAYIDIFKIILLSDNMKSLVIQSIDSPDVLIKSIMNIREELPNQIQNLEETAIAFQSGRDEDGSSKLQAFIRFIYNYSRTCFQIAPVFGVDLSLVTLDNISLEEKNREIHEMLSRIAEVMENNDIISLSDILEYEIRSAIEGLGKYIDLIVDNMRREM